jgi:hypothetical protein
MYRNLAFAMPLLLAGCAAMDTGSSTTASNLQTDDDTRATLASLSEVREIYVEPIPPGGEELICEMIAPTGTRIAQQHCYIKSPQLEEHSEHARRGQIDSLREEQRRLEQEYLESMSIIKKSGRH